MLSRMFPRDSLKTRLYLGSGLLVIICWLSSLFGSISQEFLLTSFRETETSQRFTADVLQLDRDAEQLKAKTENYLQTGSDIQYQAADRLRESLLADIAQLRTRSDSEPLDELLQRMSDRISVFGNQLTLAATERKLRMKLLQEDLVDQEAAVDETFAVMDQLLARTGPTINSNRLLTAVRLHSMARRRLLRYFIEPDARQYEQMLSEMEKSKSEVQKIDEDLIEAEGLSSTSDSDSLGEQISIDIMAGKMQLIDQLNRFQLIATRAVQATRGYMYYVNVVMAGEISEFVYDSNRLKSFVSAQQIEQVAKRERTVRRTRWWRIGVAAIAVSLALYFAFRLANSIFEPIAKLTDTFRRLAAGETVDVIPASDQSDEVGRMAAAAAVFSDNNRQTRELLKESRRLSNELTAKAEALETTNRELDNFAYVASHDLKSPLRGLRSLAEWVRDDCEHLIGDDSKQHLEQMQGRVNKMEGLLDDLLQYSRIGRIGIQTEDVDVREMVGSLIEIVDNPHGMTIETDGEFPRLRTIRQPLQQVLLNLLTNAIKYNDKGSEGRACLSVHRDGQFEVFRLTDNGIGIDPKFQQRIFQMYQRVSTMKVDGSGMGLAIVKKLVESVGGTITVESSPGEGSTFIVRWPRKIAEPEPSRNDSQTLTPA